MRQGNYLTGLLRLNMLDADDPGESSDPIAKLYDALLAGAPPGHLLLMLDGNRPVVTVQGWRTPKSNPHEITRIMNEIGEKVERFTFVLWPLDITRKLASESDLLQFEFPDMTERKWK